MVGMNEANPFSNQGRLRNSKLIHASTLIAQAKEELTPEEVALHDSVREFVLDKPHPCVGAQSAFRKDEYWLGQYASLGTEESARALAEDLYEYTQEQIKHPKQFASFLAVFDGEVPEDEESFERKLWATLGHLDKLSREKDFSWDPQVSDDPENPKFSFSFAGTAFYVVGMHKKSSRLSRQFEKPMLIFNLHRQFDELRASGQYTRLRDTIRSRDKKLQGDNNPMLADFGDKSEARQYSGRQVGAEWKCPFHH